MQDNGLQPERTFLSIERSLFSYLMINFTIFKILIMKSFAFFYIAILIILVINLYYFIVLIHFKTVTTLKIEKTNPLMHRLILLSSGGFTIILALLFTYIMY